MQVGVSSHAGGGWWGCLFPAREGGCTLFFEVFCFSFNPGPCVPCPPGTFDSRVSFLPRLMHIKWVYKKGYYCIYHLTLHTIVLLPTADLVATRDSVPRARSLPAATALSTRHQPWLGRGVIWEILLYPLALCIIYYIMCSCYIHFIWSCTCISPSILQHPCLEICIHSLAKASVGPASCQCAKGYFTTSSGGCEICPEGVSCDTGSYDSLVINDGMGDSFTGIIIWSKFQK